MRWCILATHWAYLGGSVPGDVTVYSEGGLHNAVHIVIKDAILQCYGKPAVRLDCIHISTTHQSFTHLESGHALVEVQVGHLPAGLEEGAKHPVELRPDMPDQ